MYLLFKERIENILLLLLNKRIENILLYTISQIDSYFNKSIIYIYMDQLNFLRILRL